MTHISLTSFYGLKANRIARDSVCSQQFHQNKIKIESKNTPDASKNKNGLIQISKDGQVHSRRSINIICFD